jgi:hypothetical protein
LIISTSSLSEVIAMSVTLLARRPVSQTFLGLLAAFYPTGQVKKVKDTKKVTTAPAKKVKQPKKVPGPKKFHGAHSITGLIDW